MMNLLLVIAVLLVVTVGRTGAVRLSLASASPTPGKDVFVKCTVSAGETFIGWFKPFGSKILISSTNRIRVEDTGGGVYKLQFKGVKVSDGGHYECRGSQKTVTFTLYVAFVTSDVKLIQHLENGTMSIIKVGVVGYPDPSFSWKKDGQSLNIAGDSCLTLLKDGSLKICKVTKSHRGNYTVKIEQRSSEDDVKIEVYVVVYARIEPFSRPQRGLTAGFPATFMCNATGFPAPKYKWLSPDSKELSSISNIKVQGGNLTFTTVGKDFTKGNYTCVAYIEIEETKEKIGEDRAVVEVIEVYEAPSIDPSQGGPKDLKRGDNYTLTCVATGKPTPDVTWLRDGVMDPRQQKNKGQSDLKIKYAQVGDSGDYICVAKNLAVDSNGDTIVMKLVATINVKYPPGRPIIYSPSSTLLTNETFTLKWRAPEETGGDDEITYTVRYRVEKDKNNHGPWKTITTKKLQVEISDLDNKVTYKFEVTAKNKGGVSGPAEKYIQTNFPGEAPSIDPSQGGPKDLKRGDNYTLTCVATGKPTPDVTWLRDGVMDPRQQNRFPVPSPASCPVPS